MSRGQILVPKVVALSPTSLEAWNRCERQYLLRHILGVPASDVGLSNDEGLRLHAVLRFIHEHRSCQDPEFVATVLSDHACDTDAMRSMIGRHRDRCPSAPLIDGSQPTTTSVGHHEVERARYHHHPVPMFLAAARLDAVWIHDGVFDVRDYKSGALSPYELRHDPRAWIQAWVMAPRAASLGARLRIRYEYLAPEVLEDPEPWEPDDDDLSEIEERLRATVLAIHDADFAGVNDPNVCSRCPYRSVCRDTAASGMATWPALSLESEEIDGLDDHDSSH